MSRPVLEAPEFNPPTPSVSQSVPQHVGIIMDGNRRWAAQRGLESVAGHRAGERRLFEIVDTAAQAGIRWLTVYTFSTENWRRGRLESRAILEIIRAAVRRHRIDLHRKNIRLRWLGSKEGLPRNVVWVLLQAQRLTRTRTGMTLTLCVNHGGRQYFVGAANAIADSVRSGRISIEEITEEAIRAHMAWPDMPAVDLVIRTSGEMRLSNFLTWHLEDARLVFTPELWPDFDSAAFLALIRTDEPAVASSRAANIAEL